MLHLDDIHALAAETGFDRCGATPCRRLERNESYFRRWLAEGRNASLGYMERNLEKRFDARLLVEGARTVVVAAASYRNAFGDGYPDGTRGKIASYALTTDYHTTLRAMLRRLFDRLRERCPDLRGRIFADSAPLAEKQLAVEAGLGWIGRQSLLVTPDLGSYVVLGELVLDQPCDRYDAPYEGNGCGSCRRCAEACPNGALLAPAGTAGPGAVDARRCIACHTIERDPDPAVPLHGWIFGCDACQSACPYNRRAPLHRNPAFDPLFDPTELAPEVWDSLDDETFRRRFGATPLARAGRERLAANLRRSDP